MYNDIFLLVIAVRVSSSHSLSFLSVLALQLWQICNWILWDLSYLYLQLLQLALLKLYPSIFYLLC